MTFKKGDRVKNKKYDLIGVVEKVVGAPAYRYDPIFSLEGANEDCYFFESDFEKIEVPKVPQALDDYVKKYASFIPKETLLFNLLGDFRDRDQKIGEELRSWLFFNKKKAIDAILNGYEVERDALYEVVLFKDDYVRLLLTKHAKSSYSPECDVDNEGYWEQKLTKDEIEEASELHEVDYMKIAVKVEEDD